MARNLLFLCALLASATVTAFAVQCSLIVPATPLTPAGLATPYLLQKGTDNCTMSQSLTQVFVNAIILNTETNTLYSYSPLVIDEGTTNAVVTPTTPQFDAQNSLVAIFIATNFNAFGTPSDVLTLVNAPNTTSLLDGNCLTGTMIGGVQDPFIQFSTCNAVQFFDKVKTLVSNNQLSIPSPGVGTNNVPCSTVRSFDLVDTTQSDTVPTSYILLASGDVVQNTPDNYKKYITQDTSGANSVIVNDSDAHLLDVLDEAVGCNGWFIRDLTDPTGATSVSNFGSDELQAAAWQSYPMAQVPYDDPDVLSVIGNGQIGNGYPDLLKLNAYRASVGQSPASHLADANTTYYCQALLSVGTWRLVTSKALMETADSPDPTSGTNLYTFWANRFYTTYGDSDDGFGCDKLLNIPNPVTCDNYTICTQANVTMVDPLGLFSTSPQGSTNPQNNNGNNSNLGAIIGLAVGLAVVTVGAVAFFVFVYNRSSGFATLNSSGGIALREI